ncbi:MAG TPA: ABC transporter permease subunit [Alphaproteobacteria bacterium]|nr:ABC transporter permease subunit [Alphaproteobacteria bacterium]
MLSPIIFGSPSLILKAAATDGVTFLDALRVTLYEILVAISIAWVGGTALGVVAGMLRPLDRIASPFFGAMIAIPFVILYPILIAWLGIGPESKIVFGVLLGMFPIALNTMIGVQSIERGYASMAMAMGASRLQTVTWVMVPLALPAVISGLRLGTSLLIAGVILTEMLAATDGLGFWISYNRSLFNTGQVYLGILLALAVATLANLALGRLERRYGSWRARQQAAS